MSKPRGSLHTQKGMVLLVALAILLVISLIAITSMKTAVLEERMATNMQNTVSVFHAADTAIAQSMQNLDTLQRIDSNNLTENLTGTLPTGSPIEVTVEVAFIRESNTDSGATPDATQAGTSWAGGGIGEAPATRYYEARSVSEFKDNANIRSSATQGFFYCPTCQ